jgi:hypothetical protein
MGKRRKTLLITSKHNCPSYVGFFCLVKARLPLRLLILDLNIFYKDPSLNSALREHDAYLADE